MIQWINQILGCYTINVCLHKYMFTPFSNLHKTLLPNQFESSPQAPREILKSFHHIDVFLLLTKYEGSRIKPLVSPYWKEIRAWHLESLSEIIFHTHFLKSALLKDSQYLTPKLASNFGFQITNQETQLTLLRFSSGLQKNTRWIFIISYTTNFLAL